MAIRFATLFSFVCGMRMVNVQLKLCFNAIQKKIRCESYARNVGNSAFNTCITFLRFSISSTSEERTSKCIFDPACRTTGTRGMERESVLFTGRMSISSRSPNPCVTMCYKAVRLSKYHVTNYSSENLARSTAHKSIWRGKKITRRLATTSSFSI